MSTDEHSHHSEHGVEMPIPTAWPIVTAAGVTLIAFGLVTSLVITLVGFLIAVFGAVGWFKDVFPAPQHELVPYIDEELRPAPVKVSPRRISHLDIGEGGHRSYYPVKIHRYSSGVFGGLAGGFAMAIMAMLYGLFAQHSIWYPINLMAAAGIPSLAEANVSALNQFNFLGFLVAVVSHLSLSILIGLLYTVLLPMLPPHYEWFWGGIITPLIWTALLIPMFDVVNPAMAARVDWVWFIICQISFGVVGGFVVFKSSKVETMQNWPLSARMGVHVMEKE